MAVLPMFPLGAVLFPHTYLPLHVFEPRYRELTRFCLENDSPFGVVLIERGSEVGGGDQRHLVGTKAKIVQAEESPDGRFGLLTLGTKRIRVTQWLPDFSYPQAEVDPWEDRTAVVAIPEVMARLRRALGLASELGDRGAPATVELHDDPEIALWQACSVAPIGPVDRFRLLCCDGAVDRAATLVALLDDAITTYAHRLALG